MKRILFLVLAIIFMFNGVAFAVDEFDKTDPAGTESPSDLDTLITTNNGVLNDRLFASYRVGCRMEYATTGAFYIKKGGVGCSNSSGTTVRLRHNTSPITVTWSDLDTGSEAVSTTYYVYAVADTDAATFTAKISTSSSAPSGVTYYYKLGSFYNNSSGDIEQITDDTCRVAVATGTASNGGTIPLPTGFAQSECSWIVAPYNSWDEGDVGSQGYVAYCYANSSRVVTITNNTHTAGTASYLIIGVRDGDG